MQRLVNKGNVFLGVQLRAKYETIFHAPPLDSTSALDSARGYLRKWLRRRRHYCSSIASKSRSKLQMACNPCCPDTEIQCNKNTVYSVHMSMHFLLHNGFAVDQLHLLHACNFKTSLLD